MGQVPLGSPTGDQRSVLEKTLRMKIAFVCMAASVGRGNDLRDLTNDLVEYILTLPDRSEPPPSPPKP